VIPDGYTVRPLDAGDAGPLVAAYSRNRAHLEPWEPVRQEEFYSVPGQEEAVARQLSLIAGGLLATWIVEHDGDVVGRFNLNNIVRGVLCSGSLGYWVDRAHLRRGIATAVVEQICAEAVPMGLHRVDASTMVHNAASQAVLLRAGFEQYGTAPKFLFLAGAWQDHHLYQRILHDDPL
jgi:ribosomal-protein-alanine N-acetyltransferase